MTIVVENGSVVSGANSYVNADDLSAYAAERGITLSGDPAVLLIKAMDYLESLNFIGTKHIEHQPLQWPRDEVYVDTYYIKRETIPKELKSGQMVTAIAIDQSLDPLRTVGRATKRAKAEGVEVEFMDNAPSETIVRTINAALRKLIAGGGTGGLAFTVRRA